jgi:hypothetical protein
MNIDILEFYPLEKDEERGFLSGTLRIKLPDIGIHILGVFVQKRKHYWHFQIPGRQAFNYETGKETWFPFIVFEDREKQKELIEAIREKGGAFIEKRLADTENPLTFPQKKQQYPKQAEASITRNNPPEAKEALILEKPKPKMWITPPPRKAQTKNRKY